MYFDAFILLLLLFVLLQILECAERGGKVNPMNQVHRRMKRKSYSEGEGVVIWRLLIGHNVPPWRAFQAA